MLTQVAEGVLVHQSDLLQNNTVVVPGTTGALLVEPGIQGSDIHPPRSARIGCPPCTSGNGSISPTELTGRPRSR
jgi:hypothetical protein